MIENPTSFKLTREQVETAWQYAYHFFFDFARPFPWHLVRMWDDYNTRPLENVLGPEGLEQYADTFGRLMGKPFDWTVPGE